MEKEKKFLKPEAEVIGFKNDDVILTSNLVEYDENGMPIIP